MPKPHPLPFHGRRPRIEKGRGARTNMSGRYESEIRHRIDDGWDSLEEDFKSGAKTSVIHETPRIIINKVKSPFVHFSRSINPYRGCEHGCIYCFARPTHAYLGLSPGLDFETKLYAKPDAAKLLEAELSKPRYKVHTIQIGTNTDAYQPIERTYRIMRQILGTLAKFQHPVSILTKSDLIARDIDILGPMAERRLTRCMISITTADRKLARSMEPRATTPDRRFKAIRQLTEAGIPTGVLMGPMIPGLNDSELENIMERAQSVGASYCAYTVLRLPLEVAPLFQEWLEAIAPTRAARIMRHIREMNGGKTYDAEWMRGREIRGTFPKLIDLRYRKARDRLGMKERPDLALDVSLFRVPEDVSGQGDLFG